MSAAQAEALHVALIKMVRRYSDSVLEYGLAIPDSREEDRHFRAMGRREAAVKRLAAALASIAGGAS